MPVSFSPTPPWQGCCLFLACVASAPAPASRAPSLGVSAVTMLNSQILPGSTGRELCSFGGSPPLQALGDEFLYSNLLSKCSSRLWISSEAEGNDQQCCRISELKTPLFCIIELIRKLKQLKIGFSYLFNLDFFCCCWQEIERMYKCLFLFFHKKSFRTKTLLFLLLKGRKETRDKMLSLLVYLTFAIQVSKKKLHF